MIDTQKILYILPDLAYLAEFLPGKQPNTFTVQSFKQFNGKLMDGNQLIFQNIKKLAKRVQEKIVEGKFDVVLADEIFTNTIISVEKKTEAEVKEHLQEEVIPSLHITQESHMIETFILSEYKGVFKVQLSTVQHSVLAPLVQAFNEQKVKINKIFPLSWTLKSIISLEPSVSLVEMGKNLFMAKHYIGVDQPMVDSVENLDRFVEAIKTLKGTESSMQTVYLLSSKDVEDKLKEKLGDLIPIQQVAQEESSDDKLPSYVEKAMSLAMRTISINEYEIPEFKSADVKVSAEMIEELDQAVELEEDLGEDSETTDVGEDLPKPGEKAVKSSEPIKEDDAEDGEDEGDEVETEVETIEENTENDEDVTVEGGEESKTESEELEKDIDSVETSTTDTARFYKPAEETESVAINDETEESKEVEETPVVTTVAPVKKDTEPEDNDNLLAVDLSKFSSNSQVKNLSGTQAESMNDKTIMKKTIKNDDGTKNLFKVILVGFGSFVLTIAIGVGIGFGVLKLSQPNSIRTPVSNEPELANEEVEPTEAPTPTPLPEAERENYAIKVVNATTKAGYAGEFAATLTEKAYKEVEAKNAVGDYEPGYYLLMTERDDLLIETMQQDLDIELTYSEEIATEDPQEEFDAVLVLAE